MLKGQKESRLAKYWQQWLCSINSALPILVYPNMEDASEVWDSE